MHLVCTLLTSFRRVCRGWGFWHISEGRQRTPLVLHCACRTQAAGAAGEAAVRTHRPGAGGLQQGWATIWAGAKLGTVFADL